MAVPNAFNILDISGKFTLNKTLSDTNRDEILSLQGISWLTRKAINLGTVSLTVAHYKDASGIEHVDIDQTAFSSGVLSTREERTLSWIEKSRVDPVFGAVTGKSRRTKVDMLESEFLKTGWSADTVQHGLIQSYTESDTAKSGTSWTANQTWGMQEVDGQRRYVRHVKFTGPKEEDVECRLVYDYVGPL